MWQASSNMNQQCKVCGEPAAGFHFGAFTCEGCKSFFGRSYNNLGSISECKNNGECVINKKNRTSCKACRLRKCLMVGMSKSGSRYGRRSNWFKIHCLLQEQQQSGGVGKGGSEGLMEQRIQLRLGSKEEMKLFDDYKSASASSPESHNSDSSAEGGEARRGLGGGGGGLVYHRHDHHLPLLPLVLPHPAFLPPPFPSPFPYPILGKHPAPFTYDDNFNKRFLLEAVLSPQEDGPMDLSLKSPKSEIHSEEEDEDEEEEEDIEVDDFREDPAVIRRTAPLDLTTKVV